MRVCTRLVLSSLLASPSAAQVAREGLRNLRRLCLLLALALMWSFAVAPVAFAATATAPQHVAPPFQLPTPQDVGRMLHDDAQRQERQALIQQEMQAATDAPGDARPLPARSVHPASAPAPSYTLLDEVGRLARPIAAAQVAAWKVELKAHRPAAARAALLHLWLGEVALARDQQPEGAQWHFRQARLLSRPQAAVYGLAAYDDATALDYEGAYRASADAFHRLLLPRTALPGYDHRTCVLWWRHARACDGYHQDHARLGIPEPPRLDPLCGAASLASSLQALHLPYDRKTLLAACRVTGEGSDLGDLVAAGPRLGVTVRAVAADDRGLMALPKPLVAYVERDHFVSVVRADAKGVSYLCSDCGPWPGGAVDLTWAQWHVMNPGVYAAVARPGGAWDRTLAAVLGGAKTAALPAPAVRVASAGALAGLGLPRAAVLTALLPLLRGHVSRYVSPTNPGCGSKPESQHCQPFISCPMDCPNPAMNGVGPSGGDPVNMATGEEEYTPAPDLTVYNPNGPSVVWQRTYNSMRNTGDIVGTGWGNGYDTSVTAQSEEGSSYPPPVPATVFLPNGSSITTGAIPYDGALVPYGQQPPPPTKLSVGNGIPMEIICTYGATLVPLSALPRWVSPGRNARGHYCQSAQLETVYVSSFVIVYPDRSRWTFSASTFSIGQMIHYTLSQIVDRNGNRIYFQRNNSGSNSAPLTSITNSAGTALLTVNYDGNGNLASVTDCYGRGVYYSVQSFANQNVPSGYPQSEYELTQVSQVVPTGTAGPPSRWAYGYQNVYNGDPGTGNGGETIPCLHTITVPSPSNTGPATRQATINYATDGTSVVSSLVDANLNTRTYTATSGTITKVTVSNKAGTVLYAYSSGFGSNLTQGTKTDGNGTPIYTPTYNSTTDPYQPSSVVDGNGNTWSYTYDTLGNVLTETSPSKAAGTTGAGVTSTRAPATTTYTYSYPTDSNRNPISTGELHTVQVGSKTATTYAYYEPSGLTQTVTGPQPGLAGAAAIVLDAYTYDALGNVTAVTAPGPNSTPAATTGASGFSTYVTTTLNYTTDGSYSQSDAIGEPLVVTDPLGHATHFRYAEAVPYSASAINRGHAVSTLDALGNETDGTFNIDDRPVTTVYPATGQSGSARGSVDQAYLYDEAGDTTGQEQYGPLASVKTYDEGNTSGAFRQVNYAYGPEGETLGVSGSTEPVTYTYDALYRLSALTDGNPSNAGTTRYFYNGAGYLYQTAYPLSGATTAPLAAGSKDTVTYTAYDAAGDVTGRVDGNGTATAYTYNDPESLLTNVHYTLPSGPPAYITPLADTSYTYDAYGRRQTMADATGSQSYTYGDDDGTLSRAFAYSGLPTCTVSYAYDPDGSRQSMALSGVSGGFSYAYDVAGRETGETNPYGQQSSWAYLSNDWLLTQTLGNGATTSYAYDARGQITGLTNVSGGATVSAYSMAAPGGYDGAGNRTAMACAGAFPGTTTYSYDGRDELLTEASSRTSASYTDTQHYDGVTSGTTTGPGNPTTLRGTSHTYNADNQLTGTGYAYDGDGNPITYGGTACKYDPEGRQTADGSAQSNTYDGDGLRAQKKWSNGSAYCFMVYDGDQVLAETDGSGAVNALYTRGAGGLASRTQGGTSLYYAWDPSGNVAQGLNGNGSVSASYAVDGFGRGGGGNPPEGLGGQWGGYYDAQDGLTLLTHRDYDQAAGRFLTRDPMGYKGGKDLYVYCQNQPINRNDPLGYGFKDFCKKCWDNPIGKGGLGLAGVIAVLKGISLCKKVTDSINCPRYAGMIITAAGQCNQDLDNSGDIENPPDDGSGNSTQFVEACVTQKLRAEGVPNANQVVKQCFKLAISMMAH